jgi:lipopolysaccharide/colanic/teichoic acid biosynthesis glycosyltransferase
MGYTPIAVFDDDPDLWGGHLDTVPIVGRTDRVLGSCGAAVLAMPDAPPERRVALLEGPLACYRTVVVVPDLVDAPSLWVRPRDMAGLLGLEITSNLTRPLPRLGKRALDLGVTVALAPFWIPIVLVLALGVWMEDATNPWFVQERVGLAGRPFRLFKLRTMRPDAGRVLDDALAADAGLRAEWEATFKLPLDPRVTRVGRHIRALSLDELPQLINVLRGEMSLVGPRPLPRYHHGELAADVREIRERVRPGVTGLWQVSGRGDAGTAGMERWDPYYVRNWSLWLDAVILVRTVRAVLARRGAY